MMETPFENLDLERAVNLRWALRDILADRCRLLPIKDEDLRTLINLQLVEIRGDVPAVTEAGLAALE